MASQTFVVPTNDYQWSRLATSTGQIAIACVGLMTTVYLLRNQLERLPFFRMLRLEPPYDPLPTTPVDDYGYLLGLRGQTTSRCAPVGKALIGERYLDVHAPDDLIEPGATVEVVRVEDRTIFVRRVTTNGTTS